MEKGCSAEMHSTTLQAKFQESAYWGPLKDAMLHLDLMPMLAGLIVGQVCVCVCVCARARAADSQSDRSTLPSREGPRPSFCFSLILLLLHPVTTAQHPLTLPTTATLLPSLVASPQRRVSRRGRAKLHSSAGGTAARGCVGRV